MAHIDGCLFVHNHFLIVDDGKANWRNDCQPWVLPQHPGKEYDAMRDDNWEPCNGETDKYGDNKRHWKCVQKGIEKCVVVRVSHV